MAVRCVGGALVEELTSEVLALTYGQLDGGALQALLRAVGREGCTVGAMVALAALGACADGKGDGGAFVAIVRNGGEVAARADSLGRWPLLVRHCAGYTELAALPVEGLTERLLRAVGACCVAAGKGGREVGGALGALPASASAAKTPAKTPANASAVKTPAKTSAAPLQNCAAAGKGWKADAANGVGGSFGAREMEGVVVDGRFGGSFGNRFDAGTESGVGGSFGGKRAHKTGEGGKETGRNGAEANRANKDEKKGGTVDAGEGGRVGVLFSGGVDSTALLACCVKLGLPVIGDALTNTLV
ncbi:hypothetical protein T492DRAFT_844413 [Pavlovales sp. CCMP2436]|nr:hypothetical protein T492DRAFT_844413 [Pavlovales sp. CCMP2436]